MNRVDPITEEDYIEAGADTEGFGARARLEAFLSIAYDYNFRYQNTLVKARLGVGGVQYVVLHIKQLDDDAQSALYGRLREDARQVGQKVFTYLDAPYNNAEVQRV